MFTVVTVNQYWSLFGLDYCATWLLQMNLCKHQYYFWQWLFAPKLMDRQRCTTVDRDKTWLTQTVIQTHITIAGILRNISEQILKSSTISFFFREKEKDLAVLLKCESSVFCSKSEFTWMAIVQIFSHFCHSKGNPIK